MAKKFAFKKSWRDRATVDRNEGASGFTFLQMQIAGDKFLSEAFLRKSARKPQYP